MRIKNVNKPLLAILFGCTLIFSCVNCLMHGFTSHTIFPVSNCLIVACIWMYRMFNSFLSLCIALIMIGVLLIALVRIIAWKKTFLPVIVIYLLDLIIVAYLLASSYGHEIALFLSVVADIAVVLLMVLEIKKKASHTGVR